MEISLVQFKPTLRVIVTILCVLLTISQLNAATGKITGKVVDSTTDDPLFGTNILVEGTRIGAASDDVGDYFIINVPPGSYTLRATMMGYSPVKITNVVVSNNLTTKINIEMSPEVIEGTEVVVIAERPVVQLDVASAQTVLSGEEINELAVRDFNDMLDKQAGIKNIDARGMVIRGSREAAMSLLLDGVETRDNLDNQVYTRVNPDEVEQAELLTGGFNAEYGNAGAGVLNVVTKSGGSSIAATFDARASVPTRKHFGPPIQYYFNQYYDHPEFWQETAANIKDTDKVFSGFKDRPELLRELYLWRMRDDAIKYGDKSDSYISATLGGPIPFLKNTTFFTSVKTDKSYYLYRGPQDYFNDSGIMGKITSNITESSKLSFLYRYTETSGINRYDRRFVMENAGMDYRADPWGDEERRYIFNSTEDVAWKGMGDWPYVGRMSISKQIRNQYALTYTQTLNAKTFFEISLKYSDLRVHGAPGTERDINASKTFTDPQDPDYSVTLTGEYVDAPLGYWANTLKDPWGVNNGGTFGSFEDNRDKNLDLKAMIISQVNKSNQLNAGFEFLYTDLKKEELRFSGEGKYYDWNWHVYPKHLGVWISDKLEFEGMIANIGIRADSRIPDSDQPDVLNNPWDYHWSDYFMAGDDDSVSAGPHYNPPTKWVLAPRINVSHPIGPAAKIFFNYGHYYQEPPLERQYYMMRRSDKPTYWSFGNPELDFHKSVLYEIGYEQNIMNVFRVAVTGFYKDNTNLVNEEIRYHGLAKTLEGQKYIVDYISFNSDHYQSARGFQVRFEKRVGTFWTGWVNYDYEIYSTGVLGFNNFYEDSTIAPRLANYDRRSVDNKQLTPMPRFNIGVNLHTPKDFGPTIAGIRPLASLSLNLLYWWRSQPTFTYNPDKLPNPYAPRDNMRWKAHRATNLVFQKRFEYKFISPIFYVEVYNLFNDKNMYRNALQSSERDVYLELLAKEGGKPGERGDLAQKSMLVEPNKGIGRTPYDLFLNPRQIFLGFRLEFK